jgi:hypothetical protein
MKVSSYGVYVAPTTENFYKDIYMVYVRGVLRLVRDIHSIYVYVGNL